MVNSTWGDCEDEILSIDVLDLPNSFILNQNYPNPFNFLTSISYRMPKAEFANVTIYNVLGKKIITLVNNQQTAGYKSVTEWFDKSDRYEQVCTFTF